MLLGTRAGPCALVGLSLAALACGTDVTSLDGSVGGGGGQSGGGGQGGIMPDLFACGVTHDCVQDMGHLGPVPEEDLRCGGELLASGQAGAVLNTSNPGPYPTTIERLSVLQGDGTLYAQSRWRCATDDGCGGYYGTEWLLKELQLCDVSFDGAEISGCDEPDGPCSWLAQGDNCVAADAGWSCADLSQ